MNIPVNIITALIADFLTPLAFLWLGLLLKKEEGKAKKIGMILLIIGILQLITKLYSLYFIIKYPFIE